jgi:hypothetical protein
MNKVFVSGSRSINKLLDNEIEKLDELINKNYLFLIGDANGVDLLVQQYLNSIDYRKVIIYYSLVIPRNNIGDWNVNRCLTNKSGREFHTVKDSQMTNDSDCSIVIWDGISKGTKANIDRSQRLYKPVFIFNRTFNHTF